ncbi:MAG: serine/threonine-protein kinase [Vicinamibacterales bacterium]
MSTAAPLPEKIGRYQILEVVGRGGMGVLYRGFDPVLDREVAVKVMLAEFSLDNEHLRTRFYREAKAAAKLQHRNIVTVFEFAEEANQPHIVMEYLRGIPLSSRMDQAPELTLDAKLDIVAQLCAGLGYAHSQGVVHRDVKPANVFLLDDGSVKLLDFGIAKLTSSTLTQQGDVLGSAQYMSPEQVAGSENVDRRADVWSTGVLLYELLSGRKPFDADGLATIIVKILKEEPKPIETLVQGIPQELAATVMRALEKDPAKRTPKAEELGRELQSIRKSMQASGALAPMDETRFASTNVLKALHEDRQNEGAGGVAARTLDKSRQRTGTEVQPAGAGSKTWMVAAGIALLVVGGGGGWLLFGRSGTKPDAAQASAPAQTTEPVARAVEPQAPPPVPAPDPAPAKTKIKIDKPPASAPPAPAVPAATVAVTMSAAYEFEVFDGARSISGSSSTHELPPQPNGKMLRVVAPQKFLDQQVRVDGGAARKFEYSPPALGKLDVRTARGDCKLMVGKRDLGYAPWPPFDAVAGDYQLSLSCPDGQNPQMAITVMQGRSARVNFTK